MASVYSVFYEIEDVFDICRTDFSSLEAASFWIDNNLIPENGNAVFHFVLKDGCVLIKGEVIDSSEEFFSDSMKFSKIIDPGQAWQ